MRVYPAYRKIVSNRMKIKLARSIDYCLGIPLCFLFTGADYILRAFALKKKEKIIPGKFLFIKLSEMGSIILACPLLEQAQKEYPQAQFFFLTFASNKPLLSALGKVSSRNILTIREGPAWLFIFDTLKAVYKIRKEQIDAAFDLELFSRFTAILTYLSNASKKIGFYRYSMEGLYRGALLTHKVQYNPLLHISKSYLSLWQGHSHKVKRTPELEKMFEDREISLPKFIPSKEAEIGMRDKLKDSGVNEGARLLIVNPGEGNIPLREWPLESFITLARRLLEDRRNYIIIAGTGALSKKAELLSRSVNSERCLDLVNKTTIPEVLALCNIAQALIANDGGLAHLASLTPIKKFIFFGPESPQVYAPLEENSRVIYSRLPCSPCFSAFNHRNSACKDNKCLKVITADEVFNLLMRSLI